jgi:hypothetical protein
VCDDEVEERCEEEGKRRVKVERGWLTCLHSKVGLFSSPKPHLNQR